MKPQTRLFYLYTLLYGLFPLVAIFLPIAKPGLIMNLIGFLILGYLVLFTDYDHKLLKYNNYVLLFYFLLIYSVLIYFFSDFGINVIFNFPEIIATSISYLVLPVIFAHIILCNQKSEVVFVILSKCILSCLIISLIFHGFQPDIYVQFIKRNVLDDLGFDNIDFIPRFFGIYGNSMIMGCLAALSVVFCLYNVGNYKKITLTVIFLFSIFCSLISMQRGSWVITFFSILLYLLIHRKYLTFFSTFIIVIFIPLIIIKYLEDELGNDGFSAYLVDRFTSLNGAAGERNHQWEYALDKFLQYPMGLGLGSFSHKATILHGDNAATDGNYWRILVESGVVGISVYFILVGRSVFTSFIEKNFLHFQLLLVFIFLSIGTNVMDLYFTSYIFYIILFLGF